LDRDRGIYAACGWPRRWVGKGGRSRAEPWAGVSHASQALAEQEAAEREAGSVTGGRKLAAAERRRAEEQTRAARRLRWRAASLAAALIVALILGTAAVGFARQARQRAQIATARELGLAAQNSLSTDPERSIHLALHAAAAWSLADQPLPYDLQDTLHQAVSAARARQTWSAGEEEILYAGFLQGDQPLVVTGNAQAGTVTLWDLTAERALRTLPGRVSRGTDLALSPDGRLLAVPGNDHTLKVWEIASDREWRTFIRSP
jgi:hypothetical protein